METRTHSPATKTAEVKCGSCRTSTVRLLNTRWTGSGWGQVVHCLKCGKKTAHLLACPGFRGTP